MNTELEQAGKDRGLAFEASGCDYLFIDHAHEFPRHTSEPEMSTTHHCPPGRRSNLKSC